MKLKYVAAHDLSRIKQRLTKNCVNSFFHRMSKKSTKRCLSIDKRYSSIIDDIPPGPHSSTSHTLNDKEELSEEPLFHLFHNRMK